MDGLNKSTESNGVPNEKFSTELKDRVALISDKIGVIGTKDLKDNIVEYKNTIEGDKKISALYEHIDIKVIEEELIAKTKKLKKNNETISELLDSILENSATTQKIESSLISSKLPKWYLKYRFYDKMKIINENSKINYKKALSDLELLPNIDFKMLIQENINIEIVYELEINYLKSKKTLQEVFSESKGLYDKTLEILTFLSGKK